jgi:hypothetical protein
MNQLKRIAGAGFALLTMLCAVILGVTILFGAAGCDNGTTKQCECPNKIHGNAPCACGGVGCICEQKEYSLAYNVRVINETGGKLSVGLIADIRNAMDAIYDSNNALMNGVSTRHATITITNGTDGYDLESINGNTIRIGSQFMVNYADIEFNISEIFTDMMTKPDPNASVMNESNSNINIANGRDMNAKAGLVA